MRKISRTISGARPRLGSSRTSSFGFAMSARPSASICRSPPDSVPAACLRRSFSRGKRSNTSSRLFRVFDRSRRLYVPSNRLSATDKSANSSRFSGHQAEAALDPSLDVDLREIVPLERHPPGGPQQPDRRHQQRRLAGPVRADHGHDLPFLDRQRDVPDSLHLAVGDADTPSIESIASRDASEIGFLNAGVAADRRRLALAEF